MSPDKFRDFLADQKQQHSQEETVDWEAIKVDWQDAADKFISQIESFLAEFSQDIQCQRKVVQLSEQYLGEYDIPKLIILLPKEMIELEPIGTNLIAAHGRYDMKGLAGTVKWVLVPKSAEKPTISVRIAGEPELPEAKPSPSELVWKIATPAPNIRYIPLTRETLLEAIMEVSHG